MEDVYARFNPNPTKIAAWRRLLMLEETTCPNSQPPPPDVLYSRAIPTFLHWKYRLLKSGWKAVPDDHLPTGLLFVVQGPPAYSSDTTSNGASPSSSTESVESTHLHTLAKGVSKFALPAELSAFLEYREDIQESLRDPGLFKPTAVVVDGDRDDLVLVADDGTAASNEIAGVLNDMFHLLQLIVPGMFLLVHDALSFARQTPSAPTHGSLKRHRRSMQRKMPLDSVRSTDSPRILLNRTRRALPPAEWIMENMQVLDGIFGKHLLHELLSCARDVELTVWKTVHGPDADPLDSG